MSKTGQLEDIANEVTKEILEEIYQRSDHALEYSDLDIEGVVLTMYDKRNTLTLLVENDVREYFSEKVYKTIIPRNVAIAEAPSHGKPVLVYDTSCVGSKAYIELAKEVLLKQ